MDQLFSKLTSLSYELFGIFIPGFILFLFLGWWWWCVGDLAPLLSFNYLPVMGMKGVADGYGLVPNEIKFGLVVYIAVASYFLGHLINWVGRSGGVKESAAESKIRRAREDICQCLRLSVPKPIESYSGSLEPLLNVGIRFLRLPPSAAKWTTFYPVAKCLIAQELQHSLIATYQNKYTLHRSLAVASVLWFWMTYFLAWFSFVVMFQLSIEPHWLPIFLSLFFSIMAVWGFSESYRFHWRMFGNTIITEAFMFAGRDK